MSEDAFHPKLFSESVFISSTCYGITPDRAKLPYKSLFGLVFPDNSYDCDDE